VTVTVTTSPLRVTGNSRGQPITRDSPPTREGRAAPGLPELNAEYRVRIGAAMERSKVKVDQLG
jgi:hypothetical protein